MFFLISKLLAFILTPLIWIVFFLGRAFFVNDELKRKKWLRTGLVLLIVFTNTFLFDEFARLWEVPATPLSELPKYEVGVVLGGMSSYDPELDRAQFFRGVDRLIQTVELYKRGYIKKILFTGGSGSILHPEMKEGNYVNRYLLYMGISPKDLIVESESQNTHENAEFTKKILDSINPGRRVLLITSGIHMRRSLGCFRDAGITVDPYSTDRYSGPRKFEFDHLLIPNVSAMYDWNNLIHEMTGYLVYWFKGYL